MPSTRVSKKPNEPAQGSGDPPRSHDATPSDEIVDQLGASLFCNWWSCIHPGSFQERYAWNHCIRQADRSGRHGMNRLSQHAHQQLVDDEVVHQPLSSCQTTCTNKAYKTSLEKDVHRAKDWRKVPNDVQNIKQEIFDDGPVCSAFKMYEDFRYYKSGVYVPTTKEFEAGHSIKIVGLWKDVAWTWTEVLQPICQSKGEKPRPGRSKP
ncbi:cathepsin b, putative [Perkinsus marinus ATCC 50983]|uniref:Cathepsin b, putative n=1 Tax=Perkinsus marinus (strain ATCC 50983 / TXsc) TaxID=423536 RepID=C5L3Z2_PERM5|nr:cathepsin b, putative [Perkinsus marinus ATCC 50983]EER08721.1 cathepsin b, putative [Perkinsus marinus ATCC 50983]|eukprot:XP_002776905.1 cathepsin b, putative [Perkinsus marinus ATCC 50983]